MILMDEVVVTKMGPGPTGSSPDVPVEWMLITNVNGIDIIMRITTVRIAG